MNNTTKMSNLSNQSEQYKYINNTINTDPFSIAKSPSIELLQIIQNNSNNLKYNFLSATPINNESSLEIINFLTQSESHKDNNTEPE